MRPTEENQTFLRWKTKTANGTLAGLPLVGTEPERHEQEFKVLNTTYRIRPTEENQNLPKMENQSRQRTLAGLPLVGIGSSTIHRKEPAAPPSHLTGFHDHLVLESKLHFMIILQLENASHPRVVNAK
jgi:hypothetical protein